MPPWPQVPVNREDVERIRSELAEEPYDEWVHARFAKLLRYIDILHADLDEVHRLRRRLAQLLDGVADALKGEAPDGTLHDWADLPQLARSLVGTNRHGDSDDDGATLAGRTERDPRIEDGGGAGS